MSDYVTKTNVLSALGRFKENTDNLYGTKADANDLKNACENISLWEEASSHNVTFEGDQETTWVEQTFPNIPTASNDGTFLCKADSAPSTSTDTGLAGQYFADTDYLYICIATNTWRRVALSIF